MELSTARSVLAPRALCVLALGSALAFLSCAARAQGVAHENAQGALIHLTVSGTPESGPLAGQDGGVKSQGTGFFVSEDGFLLTTRHLFDPLTDVNAFNIRIEGRIGDSASRAVRVQVVSELPRLDLALLRADIPFDMEPPLSLETGSTVGIDLREPPLMLTSGFQGQSLRRKAATLNDIASDDIPYAWTLDVKTLGGQSGSPVYIEREDGSIVVVGIIKATSRQDDELTLMVPIEYSMPLIGHLKLQELTDRVALLERAIGKSEGAESPPLNSRVIEIEGHVDEISSHFIWEAASRPDGSIIVRYDKILRGGPQIDHIDVKITPYMRIYAGEPGERDDIITVATPTLRLPERGRVVRSSLDETTGTGTFVIRGVAEILKAQSDLSADAVRGTETFRDLDIALLPHVGEQALPARELNIVPDFDWANFGSNP